MFEEEDIIEEEWKNKHECIEEHELVELMDQTKLDS